MEILIKGILKKAVITDDKVKVGRLEIKNDEITEIKYQMATTWIQGFITFCTNVGGQSVKKLEDTSLDKNSIQFYKKRNEEVEKVLEYFKDKVILTDIQQSQKNAKENLKQKEKQKEKELKESGKLYCPKCLSTQIQAGEKGFRTGKAIAGRLIAGPIGLLAGNFGSKKVELICLECGHRWEPKKK